MGQYQNIFFMCLLLISNQTTMTTSVTHWINNNAGLIVPLLTSPYYMKNSNDLVAFLNQSIHKKKLDDLKSQLILINKNLTWKMGILDEQWNELSAKLSCMPKFNIRDDSDLSGQLPKKYLQRINFLIEIDDDIPKTTTLPRCSDFLKLDFTSEPFEYLDGIKRRHKLNMNRDETVDILELGIPSFMFQQITYTVLENNPNSWKSHLLGSYFWRLKGNAREAIECARRAIHLAPQRLKDISLLSLGTILQRSNYLNDSLIVIESAVNHAPHVTENLWNLCNNYLLLSQFDKSFECFKKVERQDDAYSAKIDYIKNSFRCIRDLKITLLTLENTVNEIPPEIEYYRKLKKELDEIHEKLEKEQVPMEVREFDDRFFEQISQMKIRDFDGVFYDEKHNLITQSQICTERQIENEPVLFCDFLTDVQVIMQDIALDVLHTHLELKSALIETYKMSSLGIFQNIFLENYSNEID